MKINEFIKNDISNEINNIIGVHYSYPDDDELNTNQIGINIDYEYLNYINLNSNAIILNEIKNICNKYNFNNIDITDRDACCGYDHILTLK